MRAIKKSKNAWEYVVRHKYAFLLGLILVFAAVLRLSTLTVNEAAWWDSADYLVTAKVMADGELGEKLTEFSINPRRPFLLPFLWSLVFRVTDNEVWIQVTEALFSMGAVLVTYLIGKELFDKKVGLVSALLMSVLWVHLFFTPRLLTDVPATTLQLASLYFFYRGYVKEEKVSLWWSAVFLGLAVFTRAASLLIVVPFLGVVVAKEKWRMFTNKRLWCYALIAFIVFSPFLIWLYSTYDNPVQKFTGVGGGEQRFRKGDYSWSNVKDVWNYAYLISNSILSVKVVGWLSSIMLSPNLVGVLLLVWVLVFSSSVFLGLDILFKEKNRELYNKLLVLLWVFVPYLFYAIVNKGVEDRYLMGMFPVMFMVFSSGLLRVQEFLDKKKRFVGVGLSALVIILLCVTQLQTANAQIERAASSFSHVAYAGKWIKENSLPTERIITASKYQNLYYSERNTFPFGGWNLEGIEAEDFFIQRLAEVNPKFVVVSLYEQGFTPKWAYEFPMKHPELLKPVQGYFADEQGTQPILIIFEYALHRV